jgi:hypothetical protein
MIQQIKGIMERMTGMTLTHNQKQGRIMKKIQEMMIQIKEMA